MRVVPLLTLGLVSLIVACSGSRTNTLQQMENAALEQVESEPNDPYAHYELAVVQWGLENYDGAEAELREALALNSRFAPAYMGLAYLPYARDSSLWSADDPGDLGPDVRATLRESDELFQHAVLIDPLVDLRIVNAATVNSGPIHPSSRDLYDRIYGGFDDYRDGNFERAHYRLGALIQELRGPGVDVPNFVFFYHALAAAHLGKHDDAIGGMERLLERALEEEEGDSLLFIPLQTNHYRYILGFMNQRAGNADVAADLYRDALTEDLGLYMAHVRLAQIHEQQGDRRGGIAERRRAVNANPGDPNLLLELGIALGQAGELDESAEILREAIRSNDRLAIGHYSLGLVELTRGDRDAARESLERFVATAPGRLGAQVADARQRLDALSAATGSP